jgi:hypothetical protein
MILLDVDKGPVCAAAKAKRHSRTKQVAGTINAVAKLVVSETAPAGSGTNAPPTIAVSSWPYVA